MEMDRQQLFVAQQPVSTCPLLRMLSVPSRFFEGKVALAALAMKGPSGLKSAVDDQGNNPVHVLASVPVRVEELRAARRILLEDCCRYCPQWLHRSNVEGWTPLHNAAAACNPDVLSWLLVGHHVSVDAKTGEGCTPLHLTCVSGDIDCVEVLLRAGAQVR